MVQILKGKWVYIPTLTTTCMRNWTRICEVMSSNILELSILIKTSGALRNPVDGLWSCCSGRARVHARV